VVLSGPSKESYVKFGKAVSFNVLSSISFGNHLTILCNIW
jgi:hypothetical protein